MNCPVCSSEIQAGIKYCPVCGTDVEGAQLRMQQAAARTAPTQRMPQAANVQPRAQVQQAAASVPANPMVQQNGQNRAVPMNSSMPPQDPGRGFDTSKMSGSPKWPIVLIAILAVVVVVLAVLLAVRSCTPETTAPATDQSNDGNGTPVVAPVTTPTDSNATVGDGSQAAAPQASAGLDNAAAYTELTAAYDKLDGFHTRISAIATEFSDTVGSGDLTDIRNRAAALQGEIDAAAAALNGLNIPADSPYAANKAAIASLYNDLAMRIGVLVEACDADMAGNDFGPILSRDNGSPDEHGHTNVYLIDYEQNYGAARPVQL